MSNTESAEFQPEPDRGSFITKTEHGNVQLSWRKFQPVEANETDSHQAVVYIPGWPMDAQKNVVAPLPQAFADHGKANTFAITTIADSKAVSPREEAATISHFLHQHGITEITGASHSLGAIMLLNLDSHLRHLRGTPDEIKVKGLLLLNAAGMFNQHGLAPKYVRDFVNTYIKELGSSTPEQRDAPKDLIASLKEKIQFAGKEYMGVFLEQVNAMTHRSPLLEEVDEPTIIINGVDDGLFSYKRIAPIEKLKTNNYSPIPPEKLQEKLEKKTPEQREERIKQIHLDRENTVTNTARREQYLLENLLPNSPAVRMIVPEKHTVHAGLPMFRYDQTAKVGLELLNRLSTDPTYLRSQEN